MPAYVLHEIVTSRLAFPLALLFQRVAHQVGLGAAQFAGTFQEPACQRERELYG